MKNLAERWYKGLRTLDPNQAIQMLALGDTISTMHGAVPDRMTREKAIDLIRETCKLAPDGQAGPYRDHRIVTIDTDGFPVQLETASKF